MLIPLHVDSIKVLKMNGSFVGCGIYMDKKIWISGGQAHVTPIILCFETSQTPSQVPSIKIQENVQQNPSFAVPFWGLNDQ